MPAGRPEEYKEEYNQKVDEYLKSRQDEEYEFHRTRGEKSDTYEQKIVVRLPTIEGFALFIGVNKTSLYEWEKRHPQFSNSLDKIREEQRKRLLDKGLSGQYNSTIAKLILSHNHGMREKTETDVTSGGKPLYIPAELLEKNGINVSTEGDSD